MMRDGKRRKKREKSLSLEEKRFVARRREMRTPGYDISVTNKRKMNKETFVLVRFFFSRFSNGFFALANIRARVTPRRASRLPAVVTAASASALARRRRSGLSHARAGSGARPRAAAPPLEQVGLASHSSHEPKAGAYAASSGGNSESQQRVPLPPLPQHARRLSGLSRP